MKDELISGADLQMWLSVSRATLTNICRDGDLQRLQPQEVKRPLVHFRLSDIDAYLQRQFSPGSPAIPYRPISGDDPLVSVHEAARLLQLRSMDIVSWRECRSVPSYRIRHQARYRIGDLQLWLELCAEAFGKQYLPNKPVRQLGAIPVRPGRISAVR